MKIISHHGIIKLVHGEREQSAWRKNRPDYLLHSYIQLVALALLTWAGFKSKPQGRALIFGLGGGIISRFLLKNFPNLKVEVVEPNEKVIEYARQYFDLDPRVQVHVTDGRTYISETTETYDIVVLDAFDKNYVPSDMMTVEFLSAVKGCLNPEGILVANTWILRDVTINEDCTYASIFQPIWDFRMMPNIEGNRILLYNNDISSNDIQLMDIVKERASQLDAGRELRKFWHFDQIRHKRNYKDMVDRLSIRLVWKSSDGMILTDANIAMLKAHASFDE